MHGVAAARAGDEHVRATAGEAARRVPMVVSRSIRG